MNYSFQLYSARNAQPWDNVLKSLAEQGYKQVEGFGGIFEDVAALATSLKNAGLVMPSSHIGMDMLEDDFENTLKTIKTLGIKDAYGPFLAEDARPADAAGWKEFAHRLSAIGDKLAEHDVNFGWHNHAFEFVTLDNGQTPMEIILENAPNISWEADIAWVVVGGHDPIEWVKKYADRITAVHVKDRAPEGENADEDGWAYLGTGLVPWVELLQILKSKSAAKHYVMEHDNPKDAIDFGAKSIAYVNSL